MEGRKGIGGGKEGKGRDGTGWFGPPKNLYLAPPMEYRQRLAVFMDRLCHLRALGLQANASE
jgi:hypothetical protein